MNRSKLCAVVVLVGILSACAQSGSVKKEDGLNESDKELFLTRTALRQPSPELTRALELDVAPWHKKGVTHVAVKLPQEAIKRHQEAALAALEALSPEVAQDDFDRAWITLEKANVLRDLGRNAESVAAYEKLLNMAHTPVQDWYARYGLFYMSDKKNKEVCDLGIIQREAGSESLPLPPLLRQAAIRGIQGWVWSLIEVEPDGKISNVIVESSSMRVFEKYLIETAYNARFTTKLGVPLGRSCFLRRKDTFKMNPEYRTQISVDDIEVEDNFSYHSIGAAIRVRIAARAEVLAKQAAEKSSGAKASK
ncbi:hypothetical protein CJD38_15455 [Stenotrophobium rhamnosiphilum]|uniref:TonB C-terminal domain-containing protein n=2 Tax=Stenotrophobium rhamnosiphilum TaxID=2029166 RepID=A0A2T5MCP5_9GAMM|nr:hypothetical protein CJD38_15455 [Stenotrophobium rhamnosiphilum]